MTRHFTLAEANALIPRLTIDFERIAALRAELSALREEVAAFEQKRRSNGKDLASEIQERQQKMETLANQVKTVLDDIANLGCEVKDVEMGLVDFPSLRDKRTVYLCWKLGEAKIGFWHELSTGYAGRQPL
jgi:hypothetical protein